MAARLIDHYDGESGALLVSFPRRCALDCSRPGQSADESVAYWLRLPQVTWHASDDALRQALKGYGAWDDLADAPTALLRSHILWIAACDWRESR